MSGKGPGPAGREGAGATPMAVPRPGNKEGARVSAEVAKQGPVGVGTLPGGAMGRGKGPAEPARPVAGQEAHTQLSSVPTGRQRLGRSQSGWTQEAGGWALPSPHRRGPLPCTFPARPPSGLRGHITLRFSQIRRLTSSFPWQLGTPTVWPLNKAGAAMAAIDHRALGRTQQKKVNFPLQFSSANIY